ncbi:hypothetical protein MSG37_12905 [Shewanella sp. 1CM18E]|uniref:hypothetical protein n=1 Tax=Shewanella sp. 1CM18E TaxID=2929169 RepID=UPI0020C14844|nr:hypothetical protein [Shewanella sp. 1CM18E]MCK8045782.1 hypothetical protein [Shewanella sp. 1CM18E]
MKWYKCYFLDKDLSIKAGYCKNYKRKKARDMVAGFLVICRLEMTYSRSSRSEHMGAEKPCSGCNAFKGFKARVTCYEAGDPAQRRDDIGVGIYAYLK